MWLRNRHWAVASTPEKDQHWAALPRESNPTNIDQTPRQPDSQTPSQPKSKAKQSHATSMYPFMHIHIAKRPWISKSECHCTVEQRGCNYYHQMLIAWKDSKSMTCTCILHNCIAVRITLRALKFCKISWLRWAINEEAVQNKDCNLYKTFWQQ